MSKEMIVSVNGREKKIAILDNGKVTEFYIERGEENQGVAGNVYKGRVMRVLPGMQSAFVDIGLERDAFLYVSDFFDEEEEIERIVLEKGKKGAIDEVKREARDQVDRQRVEREKQMESAQRVAEPLAEGVDAEPIGDIEPMSDEAVDEILPPPTPEDKPKRGRGRGGRGRKEEVSDEPIREAVAEPIEIDFDSSGFERISDDSDTGEMFKDAYMQEAIVDRVRAVEFDMESTTDAEVGSLLSDLGSEGGFERIADEDEDAAPAKGRGRGKSAAAKKPAAEKKAKAPKAADKKPAEKKPKATSSRSKKKPAGDEEPLADADASVRESDGNAEMAVRRGGRGRRRNVKPKGKGAAGDETDESNGTDEVIDANGEITADVEPDSSEPPVEAVEPQADGAGISEEETPEPIETVDNEEAQPAERSDDRGNRDRDRNDRSRRGGRGGRDRNDPP